MIIVMEGTGKHFSKKEIWVINLKGTMKKKLKEGSSASSTDDTNVFGDGLESADCKAILYNCLKNWEVKVKEIFDLANTKNESQIKEEQQLKCLWKSVETISARFDEYEVDHKKKDEMINSLEDKVLVLTVKIDKLSSVVDTQEQYSRRNCILIHGVKENQNEDTDEIVTNKIKSEIDLLIIGTYWSHI